MYSAKFSDDDDDLFLPKPSQHLANLFNTPMQQPDDNASLKYVAPKQSTTNLNVATEANRVSPSQNTILLAKRVNAYKNVNKQYVIQGIFGLAAIEISKIQYKIILYKDKQNIISSTNIMKNTKITIQNLYCYFTDDLLTNWAILFENEKDLHDFIDILQNVEVDLIRSGENKTTSIKLNTEQTLNENTDHPDISTEVKSEIRDTKAKILSLMEKMGQTKLLPELHSTVDNTTDSSDTENLESSRELPKLNKPLAKPRKLDKIGAKSANTVPNSSVHYSLINGKMVPVSSQADASMEICITSDKKKIAATNMQQYAFVNGQLVPVMQQQIMSSNFPMQNTNIQDQQNAQLVLSSSSSNDNLNMFLCENRIHNSEIRMNISKLEQKIEKVLDLMVDSKTSKNMECTPTNSVLLEHIHKQESVERAQAQEIQTLKLKLKDFEEIYKNKSNLNENDAINGSDEQQLLILDYESKIKVLELKLKDFEGFYHEKAPLLEKYEENRIKLIEYEKTIENLNLKLKDFECYYKDNINKSKKDNEDLEKLSEKLSKKVEESTEYLNTIKMLETKLNELEDSHNKSCDNTKLHNEQIQSLNENINVLRQEKEQVYEKLKFYELSNDALSNKLKEYEMKISKLETENKEYFSQSVKSIMNAVFGILSESFPVEKSFVGADILRICRQAIKKITLETLQTDKKSEENKNSNSVTQFIETNIEQPPPPPDFDI